MEYIEYTLKSSSLVVSVSTESPLLNCDGYIGNGCIHGIHFYVLKNYQKQDLAICTVYNLGLPRTMLCSVFELVSVSQYFPVKVC